MQAIIKAVIIVLTFIEGAAHRALVFLTNAKSPMDMWNEANPKGDFIGRQQFGRIHMEIVDEWCKQFLGNYDKSGRIFDAADHMRKELPGLAFSQADEAIRRNDPRIPCTK